MQAHRMKEWTHRVSEARFSAAMAGGTSCPVRSAGGSALVAYGSNAHAMATREQKRRAENALLWLCRRGLLFCVWHASIYCKEWTRRVSEARSLAAMAGGTSCLVRSAGGSALVASLEW